MKDLQDTESITLKKKKRCEEFYSNVSIGGFKYMFLESGIKQKIWIIIFFVVLFSSIWIIHQVINDYHEHKFYLRFDRIPKDELDVPTVTICNFNSLRISKLKKLNLSDIEMEKFLKFYHSIYHPQSENITQPELVQVAKILKQRSNISTMFELVNRTENTMYDMLNAEVFPADECSVFDAPCTGKDFRLTNTWFRKTSMCSQINPYVEGKESSKTNKFGMLASFAINTDLHVEDIHRLYFVEGLQVMVHPYGTPAFFPDYTYVFSPEVGYQNFISLTLQKHQRLPAPFASKCGKKDFKIIRGYPYSKAMCEVDFILAKVLQLCHCVGYEFEGHIGAHRICSIEEHRCYLHHSKRIKSELDSSIEKRNNCNCPLACKSYSYKIDHSKLALGNHNRIKQLIKRQNLNITLKEAENYIKNNMIGLMIFYKNLVVHEIEETRSVTFSNLLGTVGGNIGLFIIHKNMNSYQFKPKSKRAILWKEFYSEVSLDGFKYLFSGRGLIRGIWIIGFLGALLFSAYLNLRCIQDFATFRCYSAFEQNLEKEIDFPSITICNMNSLLNYKIKQLGIEKTPDEVKKYYEYFEPSHQNISYKLIQDVAADLLRRNISSVNEMVNNTDITFHDMFDKYSNAILPRSCYFYGEKCSPNDFHLTSTRLPFLPYCHEFNPYIKGKKSLKVKTGGAENNFKFVANLHVDELLYTPLNMAGLMVMIHPYGTPIGTDSSTVTFFATPGRMNILQLQLKKRKLLPPPFTSSCGERDFKILKGYPYSQAACEADCVFQEVYKICDCVGHALKDYVDNIPICNITGQVCSMRESRRLHKILKCKCPSSCEDISSYDVKSSDVALGSETAIKDFIKIPGFNASYDETEDFIEKNMIGIWVYFENLVVAKETMTKAVSWSNVLGNVGGNIGLGVGFSVITVYEFGFFFGSYIWSYKKKPQLEHNIVLTSD